MYSTKEERIAIGKDVCQHKMTAEEASRRYGVTTASISNYCREYLKSIGLDPVPSPSDPVVRDGAPDYLAMTKEELIRELMRKDIEVARAKKGYAVKGGGKTKEFISISNASSK